MSNSQLAEGRKISQEKITDAGKVQAGAFGNVWYVDSNNGADGNQGFDKRHAFATLGRALEVAGDDDTIVLNPNGAETVTVTLTISQARLTIVCPAKNRESGYAISAAGTIDILTVSGADVLLRGLVLKHTGATASAAHILTTAAADRLRTEDCVYDDSAIVTTFTGAGLEITNAVNGFEVVNCLFKDCKFGVYYVIANGISQIGSLVKRNTFFIGKSAAFGVASALTGSGAVKGARILDNIFIEANGDGSAATAAWDGTDNTNATQGPIKFEAAVDQYLVAGNLAYTALATTFNLINAVNAGAAGAFVDNKSATGGDFEDFLTVPTADASTNAYARDVAGNKTDAAVVTGTTTKSLMAYLKGLLTLHLVPTADATTNVYMRDVVGIKTDAAVGTVGTQKSIMAYIKGLLGFHTVPTADVADNAQMRDVAGNKTDAAVVTGTTTKSLMAYIKGLLTLHLVPTADATTNVYMRDVVGIKTDAAVGTVGTEKSIMAYVKGLLGFHTVPTADVANNAQMRDVAGNKTDAAVVTGTTTKSLMAYLKGLLTLHLVPTADATTNVYMRDVVGIKTDAAVGTVGTEKSIMAYVKGLLGFHTVPTADVADNAQMRDVVGNKTDAAVVTGTTTKSLMAYIKGLLTLHLVPTADAETNVYARDVIGIKTDAAVTTVAATKSLMAYVKGLINQIAAHILRTGAVVKKTGATVSGVTTNLFTVTGVCAVRVVGVITTDITRAGGVVTAEVGVASNTAKIIAQTADVRAVAGVVFGEATVAGKAAAFGTGWVVVAAGTIIQTLSVAADAGVLDYYCDYIPLSTDGAVAAA